MSRRRRANQEGSVYWNEARERWEALLTVGRNANGSAKRRKFTGRTRAAVLAKLDAAKRALAHGMAIPDPSVTISDYAGWWLAEALPSEGLAPRTEDWYGYILERYVLPHVGHRSLTGPNALTVGDVERMLGRLDRDGLSPRTRNGARVALSKLLRSAERNGLISRNVARLAPAPKSRGEPRPVRALTGEQVRALLDALEGSRWHPVVVVGVTTGLRPGELLALHWENITLGAEPHVTVRHALSWRSGHPPVLKAPKRERSYRTVPLPAEAVAALRAWKRAQAAERLRAGDLWSPDWPGLVFTTEDGRPRRVGSYRKALAAVMPGVSPHWLRHTYATHLIESGVPIAHVAELLGDSVATVEVAYKHVLRAKHEIAHVAATLLSS